MQILHDQLLNTTALCLPLTSFPVYDDSQGARVKEGKRDKITLMTTEEPFAAYRYQASMSGRQLTVG